MRCLRYVILFSSIVLAPLNTLFADDHPIKFLHHPIIFLHGIQTPATPGNGWPTWNSSNSAMMEIINSEYSGYKAGDPLKCHKDKILQTMPDSKRIYNFSYYNPDGSRGVIGNNGNYEPVDNGYPNYLRDAYNSSANNACWAEHLADFIDTVLAATGASKVDIVAHSMGGLVARAAITYYGCENKVDKLLTLGTPHHAFTDNAFIEVVVANLIPGYDWWQKKGELLEMGVHYWSWSGDVQFRDVGNHNNENDYCGFLLSNYLKRCSYSNMRRTGISRLLSAISLKKGGLFEKTLPFCFTYCFFY